MTSNRNDLPRPEYPRPQFARSLWLNLNGEWEFAFDDADDGLHQGWHDVRELPLRITVPFAYQTPLSGINAKSVHEIAWYARTFELPQVFRGRAVLLTFRAVASAASISVNRREVGPNPAGHASFQCDS